MPARFGVATALALIALPALARGALDSLAASLLPTEVHAVGPFALGVHKKLPGQLADP